MLLKDEDMDQHLGKVGGSSFLVRIYFKQHADWQGTIQWLETNKTVSFRSVLELISLLNEAVDKEFPVEKGIGVRSWENLDCEQVMENGHTEN